ncbi:hypothetical protein GE061_000128 [Apolygus lucorum]|uniref:Reverse transcriptase domain-containing protein n=1 Tax=Apolygus lucorum TaxID=248454 RepID=A0A8S9Y3Q3_APOLU|nr:hypothetical protein GE061_000128 [Apolygus lucorum]
MQTEIGEIPHSSSLAGAMEEFELMAKLRGLQINETKSMYMKTSGELPPSHQNTIRINDHNFPVCNEFKYLSALITKDNDVTVEIKARIAAGNRCFWSIQKALKFRGLSRKAKLTIYRTMIRPVVAYGSETWVLTHSSERMLNCWERKILRKIFGPVCEGGRWRIRHNRELGALYGQPDLVAFIRRGRLRWLGHVQRMEENRYPKKAMNGTPGGRRITPAPDPRLEAKSIRYEGSSESKSTRFFQTLQKFY